MKGRSGGAYDGIVAGPVYSGRSNESKRPETRYIRLMVKKVERLIIKAKGI